MRLEYLVIGEASPLKPGWFSKGRKNVRELRKLYRASRIRNPEEINKLVPGRVGQRFARVRSAATSRPLLPKYMWAANEIAPEETLKIVSRLNVGKLKEYGFTPSQLLRLGKSIKDMKAAGYTVKDFISDQISIADLKDAGFSVVDLANAGASWEELHGAGFSNADIKYGFRMSGLSKDDLDKLYAKHMSGEKIQIRMTPPEERAIAFGYTFASDMPIGVEQGHRVIHVDESGNVEVKKVTGTAEPQEAGEGYDIKTPKGPVEVKRIRPIIRIAQTPVEGSTIVGTLDNLVQQVKLRVNSVKPTTNPNVFRVVTPVAVLHAVVQRS